VYGKELKRWNAGQGCAVEGGFKGVCNRRKGG
jgi:hypothetical protein